MRVTSCHAWKRALMYKAFDPAHLPGTLDALAAAQVAEVSPETAILREDIAESDRRLARYRAALDAGGDPAVIGQWITDAQAGKLDAEAQLHAHDANPRAAARRMSKEEIATVVDSITGLMAALRDATAADKAEIYAGLALRLTYNPGLRTLTTRAEISQTCTKGSCPRGDLNTETGEISPVRGNHATKITRTGPARTGIQPGVHYLPRNLACAWPGGWCGVSAAPRAGPRLPQSAARSPASATHGADHPGAERRRRPVPVRRQPQAQPAPDRCPADAAHGGVDPGQPAIHRPTGVKPAAHRLRPGRPRQHRPGPQAGAAVEPAREMDHLKSARASCASPRGRLHRRPGRHRGPAGPAARKYLLAGLLA